MRRPFLILTVLFVLFILINVQSFIDNVLFYASGSVAQLTIKGQWWFAALNIVVFLSLLFFLGRRSINWKTHGLFSAFIISLFIEMYGTSLLLYFLSDSALGIKKDAAQHPIIFGLNLFGLSLDFDLWMAFGAAVIITGIAIIMLGWYQLWSSKQALFTGGLYQHSRHPQYIGFLFTIWGWMIAWPTITTLVFTPILTIAYLYAAKKEGDQMLGQHKEYAQYVEKTVFLM